MPRLFRSMSAYLVENASSRLMGLGLVGIGFLGIRVDWLYRVKLGPDLEKPGPLGRSPKFTSDAHGKNYHEFRFVSIDRPPEINTLSMWGEPLRDEIREMGCGDQFHDCPNTPITMNSD